MARCILTGLSGPRNTTFSRPWEVELREMHALLLRRALEGPIELIERLDYPTNMAVVVTRFVQTKWQGTEEFREVTRIADALTNHLNTLAMQTAIASAHGPRAPSSLVQATFLQFALELGFRNEATGLFRDYESRLRPDYFRQVGSTGILLEVERGKTITNNMDMLDFWKCHLCASAHYLFLLVPQDLRHGDTGFAERPYSAVVRRLAPFFSPKNYTNVRGLFVFGY